MVWVSFAVEGPKILGPITPLGGVCFIAGWAMLAFSRLSGGDHSD